MFLLFRSILKFRNTNFLPKTNSFIKSLVFSLISVFSNAVNIFLFIVFARLSDPFLKTTLVSDLCLDSYLLKTIDFMSYP